MNKQEKMLTYLYESMQSLNENVSEISLALKITHTNDYLRELDDVASNLNVSRSTLFRFKKQGKLHFTKIGNKSYVCNSEVKRFLEQNKTVREDELQF